MTDDLSALDDLTAEAIPPEDPEAEDADEELDPDDESEHLDDEEDD